MVGVDWDALRNLEEWGWSECNEGGTVLKSGVKSGFSDLTKEQEGRDWQGKALREGCHERKKAQTSVSSREKKDTNRNLVRVTTKSKSSMQTISNGCVS